jgi:purine-nucleoside/S-methyl-5'-thioadenosine phosphorylase / adenosine deaminase
MILPLPAPPFVWRERDGRPSLVCPPLETYARHIFTSSLWSLGSRDGRENADDPWLPVAQAIDVAPGQLARLRQVHGATVVTTARALQPTPEGDILIVGEPGAGGAVQVADCVPVLIADRRTRVVAAVHAGWRGLAARAPQVAVEALVRECGASAGDFVVALGPSVGACCYEVGPDVREQFAASGFGQSLLTRWFRDRRAEMADNPPIPAVRDRPPRPDRWFFDGWAAARDQLTAAGVPADCIHSAGLCTASHPQVFCSYRRDGAPSGRLAAAIRCESRRP